MKVSFERHLESLFARFPEWDDNLRTYIELTYRDDDGDDLDEHVQVSLRVHNIFETLFKVFTAYGEFKDTWDFPARLDVFPFGQQTIVQSEKMGVRFDFGIYHNELFLHSDLSSPFYLKSMDDEFWSHFIALKSHGQFEFLENAVPSSNEANMAMKELKNTKSSIFQLIRNYIILELYEGGAADIGALEIKWPVTESWDSIIKNGASAFNHLYRINYMLYRTEYLHSGSRKRLRK
ncbi:MAG: hypothetical protein HY881_13895 [Deltaproteobacteria bacterium]|nr:hypothetical protein [Deltaproteobacteria bacterium]